jgi:FkbM family methyltransferase
MKITYGIENNSIDVTSICFSKLKRNGKIIIPFGDVIRSTIFTDPLNNVCKSIFIEDDVSGQKKYGENVQIVIDELTNSVVGVTDHDIYNKLIGIHSTLQLRHGSFKDEFPEQKMALTFITGSERVLEIGGNIGRNSLIIATIMKNNPTPASKFVTLECDAGISRQLAENRDLNHFDFQIEPSALSVRTLIQKGWDTMPSDTLLPGYKWVNTITFNDLQAKYDVVFDTLVLDCEGAFYYILMDMPEILTNIELIIMENDYTNISHKTYIDTVLKGAGFMVFYSEQGGWGPCYNNFFEVWKKI